MCFQPQRRSVAVRPRSAKSPSPERWLELKARISYLYCDMDMNLKVVMELMKLEYQFDAT